MPRDLHSDLRQDAPFRSLQQEAFLNLSLTEAELHGAFEQMLQPYGITMAQYNVLRILRGSDHEGLCRYEVRDRMVTRMPDVTRLLDRMEEAGLVTRVRSAEDRRLVRTQLTDKGKELVDQLDEPVAAEHERQLGHLNEDQLRALNDLLEAARSGR